MPGERKRPRQTVPVSNSPSEQAPTQFSWVKNEYTRKLLTRLVHKCPFNVHGMHASEDVEPVSHISFDEMSQLDLEYRIVKLSTGHCFHINSLRNILRSQPHNPRCPCTMKPLTSVDINVIQEVPTWPGYLPDRSDDNRFYKVLGPLGQVYPEFRLSSAHLMHPPGFDSMVPNGWPYSYGRADRANANIEVDTTSKQKDTKTYVIRTLYLVAKGSTSVPVDPDEGPGSVPLMELSNTASCNKIFKMVKQLATYVTRGDELYTFLRILKKDAGTLPLDHRDIVGRRKPESVESYLRYLTVFVNKWHLMYPNRVYHADEIINLQHK